MSIPATGPTSASEWTTRIAKRENTTCCSFNRSISSPMHSVLVTDGTSCGVDSFCQNNTCIEQPRKSSCHSQKTCSGNGVSDSMIVLVVQAILLLDVHVDGRVLLSSTMERRGLFDLWLSVSRYQYIQSIIALWNRLLSRVLPLSLLHNERDSRFRVTDGICWRSNDDLSPRDPMHDYFLFIPVRHRSRWTADQ